MAHILKVTAAGARGLLKHCARTEEAENPNVDRTLTDQNRNLTVSCIKRDDGLFELKYHSISGEEVEQRYIERMKNVRSMKRADVKSLVSLVVTAPEGLTEEQSQLFLRRCVGYAATRFGEKNVIAGCIHLDEPGARPHVHVLMTPVIEAEKKGERFEKLCCKKFLTREDYTQLHTNLERFVRLYGKLPKIELTNGVTKASGGNRTISQLKYDSAMAALSKQQGDLAIQKADLDRQRTVLDQRQADLDSREAELKQQRELNARESKRLADLLAETNAARAAAKAEDDKLAAKKAAIDAREAALDERERGLERKVAQADLDFISEMVQKGFSGDEIQVFKMIPREQWEMMRESLIFADKPGREKLEKMAASVQYEKRFDGVHVTIPLFLMEKVRTVWRKLDIMDKENRDFRLVGSVEGTKVDKRVDAAVLSESPSKEDAFTAFCGGKEVMAAWRKDLRKAAVERTFQRFGLTAAKTWAYDRER